MGKMLALREKKTEAYIALWKKKKETTRKM
jgi:hypothetical protein